ncbi:unnamed protein product [Prorocentrum cordatum]|uniref:Major facilitator superfamily (MFS) profile domain-containing protein n=1 Tax=Prorocentrum cordatum TaxID=2364126 RepID=A0ABN9VV06_9DINO|nr:unnamed protein product [Polarella glacialis]
MAGGDDHGRTLPLLSSEVSSQSLLSPMNPDSPCGDEEGQPGSQPGSPTSASAAELELPLCLKVFVFVVFTQVVQALMSYDGGATQFSTEQLGSSGWSPLELGSLGAMDKIGQVATAFVWGALLMRHDNKIMLAVGLFWKALCCFLFGYLQWQRMTAWNKCLMLVVKLGMGISEALISVWATVWVQRMAPPDARARWLGLAGTSAGLGNGVGSGVASLWDPVMAFFLQAAILFAILGVLVLLPGRAFSFKSAGADLAGLDGDELQEGEAMPVMARRISNRPQMFLATEAAYRSTQSHTVVIESVRYPG